MENEKSVTLLIKDGKFRNQGVIRSETKKSYDFFSQCFYRPNKDSKLKIIR